MDGFHQSISQAARVIQDLEERVRELQLEVARKQSILSNHCEPEPEQQPRCEEEEEEEVTMEMDDDTFQALESEANGDLELAKLHHLAAYERLIQVDPVTETSARGLAAFASFAVRNANMGGEANEDFVEEITDAFEALADFPAISQTVECEHAVFWAFTLGDSAKAWESFRRARDLYPEDVQLLCNYARFVDSVLVQEAEEDGDVQCIPELKELAAELYGEALELSPLEANALVNLSAIFVEQSREKKSVAERKELLQRARDLLLRALEQSQEQENEGMMRYNLACIECLLLGKASAECSVHLKRAVQLDPSLRSAIVQDPDLSAIRMEKWCLTLLRN